MRILMISWEYPPHIEGGLGRHVAELVPALTQQGVELHIVTPTFELPPAQLHSGGLNNPGLTDSTRQRSTQMAAVDIENGVVVHRVFAPQNNSTVDIYGRVIEVNQLIEAYVNQVDEQYGPWELIHTHDWLTGFTGMALKRAKNYPLLATIHATERGRVRGHLSNHLQWTIDKSECDLIHEADRVIVCSRHMFNELQSFFQVAAPKLDIVPNGVDISGLHNYHNEDMSAFRAKYAAPHERIVFTVSRLVYEKGVHLLIEATPRIINGCPSARIVIAGKGPEADNLQRQAEALGMAHKVNLAGFISDEDRNRLFKVSDCAMFPSLYEPFGIVALEAMALGCPVVVSDVGGFSEVVAHTETGITTYADNAESVAWGVLQALTHPELAQKYAARARQSIQELFAWSHIAALTKDVYQRTLEVHRAPTAKSI